MSAAADEVVLRSLFSTAGSLPGCEGKWAEAIARAERLQIHVPFFARLKESEAWASVDPELRDHAEKELVKTRMLLALLDIEFELSVSALKAAGIPVIVVKGMDLGRRYYRDRVSRPMTDVDLLVPRDAFASAIGALEGAGFRSIGNLWPGRAQIEMARGESSPAVELHWQLLPEQGASELAALWERARRTGLEGCRSLAATDHLAYLIRHAGLRHRFESLSWWLDLHLLISSDSIDWTALLDDFAEHGGSSSAAFALRALSRACGTPVPEGVLARLDRQTGWLKRRFLGAPAPDDWVLRQQAPGALRVMWSRLLLNDGIGEWARHLKRSALSRFA